VEDLFCISDRTASRYLRQLTEAGQLTPEGSGRGSYYTPPKTPAKPINPPKLVHLAGLLVRLSLLDPAGGY